MKIVQSISFTVLVSLFGLSMLSAVFSQESMSVPVAEETKMPASKVTLDKGYSEIEDTLYEELYKLLEKDGKAKDYYIGSVSKEKNWALVSVSTLLKSEGNKDHGHDGSYLAEDRLVIARTTDNGKTWQLALQDNAEEFNYMVNNSPNALLDSQSKTIITGESDNDLKASVKYKFPWQEFNNKKYSQGWHGSATPGLDFLSTASDRRILSSAAGTVTNVSICTNSVNVTVKHADGRVYKYLHLNKSEFNQSTIRNGVSVRQGKRLGLLRKGSFSDNCGYANQTSSTHHLHWGLPTNVTNTIDLWSINYSNNCWSKSGYSNRCVGSTFGSTNKEV